MGKAHRGRRAGESETAIQREALPDFLSASDQTDPTCQSRRDVECEGGSSLFDQTPSHEGIRGSSQGVGNQTWVAWRTLVSIRVSSCPSSEPQSSKAAGDQSIWTPEGSPPPVFGRRGTRGT